MGIAVSIKRSIFGVYPGECVTLKIDFYYVLWKYITGAEHALV